MVRRSRYSLEREGRIVTKEWAKWMKKFRRKK